MVETETEILIGLVKNRPFLYNRNDIDFRNRAKRIQAWQEIASFMGSGNGTTWSAKWKGIKDNYGKYRKAHDSDPINAQAYKKYKHWPWADHVRFLGECVSTFKRPNKRRIEDDPLHVPECKETTDDGNDSMHEEESVTNNKRSKSNEANDTESNEDIYVKMRNFESLHTLDGVDHFFLSYAQSFKQLPTKMQIMLKLEIATLFSRYELQAEGVTHDSANNIQRLVEPPIKYEFEFSEAIDECNHVS